jgi:hypothetical protein
MITREQFVKAVGREPALDDLERCNCQLAGEVGHYGCGWNYQLDKPQFMVGIRNAAQAAEDARDQDNGPGKNGAAGL